MTIVTVTANTTIDLTVFVPAWKPDTTIRATRSAESMGGKPTDASFILGELGIPSLALGFAAGPTGQKVVQMLAARGVESEFVWVDGDTRTNVVVIDEQAGSHTTVTTTTMTVSPVHIEALLERVRAAMTGATVLVTGGSLPFGVPPSFYAEVIQIANEAGVPVIFDAAEPNLSAGLRARPTLIKPNRDELAALLGRPVRSVEDAYQAGGDLQAQYGVIPVITLGSEGGLAVLPGRAYRIPPIPVEVISPAGAGDAVLAGIAASFERRQPLEDGLRLGFAAATAVLLQPGTADCRRADVDAFLPQVQLLPYP
ncbi:MAG TPA: 1-phosphofructokinase family hexose kinase [Candidatus Limnocylindrales bacterium]|nr:1-phosphofructokinase family hexose kinase [Candidatus Limnocylindrales bacterium]